eukprot:4376030-Lingulodinium_polyedra.AAC.1
MRPTACVASSWSRMALPLPASPTRRPSRSREKDFERIGHGWLWRVLHAWRLPVWAVPVAEALVCDRI